MRVSTDYLWSRTGGIFLNSCPSAHLKDVHILLAVQPLWSNFPSFCCRALQIKPLAPSLLVIWALFVVSKPSMLWTPGEYWILIVLRPRWHTYYALFCCKRNQVPVQTQAQINRHTCTLYCSWGFVVILNEKLPNACAHLQHMHQVMACTLHQCGIYVLYKHFHLNVKNGSLSDCWVTVLGHIALNYRQLTWIMFSTEADAMTNKQFCIWSTYACESHQISVCCSFKLLFSLIRWLIQLCSCYMFFCIRRGEILKFFSLVQGHSDELCSQHLPSANCQGSNSPIHNRQAVQFSSKSSVSAH